MHIMLLWYIFIAYRVVYLILNVTHFLNASPRTIRSVFSFPPPFPSLFIFISSVNTGDLQKERKAIKFLNMLKCKILKYSIPFYVSHSEPPPEEKPIHHHYHNTLLNLMSTDLALTEPIKYMFYNATIILFKYFYRS